MHLATGELAELLENTPTPQHSDRWAMDVIKYESMGQCVNRAWSVEKHFANLVPAKGAAAPAVVGPAPAGAPAPPAPAPKAAAKKAPGAPGDTFEFTRAWLKSLGAALSIDGDVAVNKPN